MKKILFSALAVVAVSLSAFGGYMTCPDAASTSNQLLAENIEALSYNLEEVTITCSAGCGNCWYVSASNGHEYLCQFNGDPESYCC